MLTYESTICKDANIVTKAGELGLCTTKDKNKNKRREKGFSFTNSVKSSGGGIEEIDELERDGIDGCHRRV